MNQPTHPRLIAPISLGTVQLGQNYGVANRAGMPDYDEAMAILDTAWANGVRTIDTAPEYGTAEARVGQWIKARGHRPFIVTKVGAIGGNLHPESAIRSCVIQSMSDLGVSFLDGLMLHRAQDLYAPGVVDSLVQLLADGSIGGFGVSAYQVEDVDAALAVAGLSMVQVPFNLFDRRMETSGVLARCKKAGVTVFARSLFLQGVFFLEPEGLPDHLAEAKNALIQLRTFANDVGRNLQELAVVAVRDISGITSMVVGAERADQITEFMKLAAAPPLTDEDRETAFMIGYGLPETIYHPGLWR